MMQLGDLFIDEDGKQRGIFALDIWGPWEYFGSDRNKITSDRLATDAHAEYFMRMEDFADHFPAKSISGIKVAPNGKQVIFGLDSGTTFTVWHSGSYFVNYSEFLIDQKGKVIGAKHARPDEKTGQLVYSEADSRRY